MRIIDVLQTRRTTESILYKHIDLKMVRKSVKIIPKIVPKFIILITAESNVSNKLIINLLLENSIIFCKGKYLSRHNCKNQSPQR